MKMLFLVLLVSLTLSPPACPTPAHPLARRSPIDLKAKPSQPIITHNHIQTDRKPKAPFIPAQHQLYIPPHLLVLPARSNVRHSSVHTDVHHISNGHVNIPVVTQTVHHSSSNITHPGGPLLVHHYEPVLVHDLSVIPLHRASRPGPPGQPRAAARSGFEQQAGYVPFPYFGGYGAGLRYGGHGAGHGFYVAGFR